MAVQPHHSKRSTKLLRYTSLAILLNHPFGFLLFSQGIASSSSISLSFLACSSFFVSSTISAVFSQHHQKWQHHQQQQHLQRLPRISDQQPPTSILLFTVVSYDRSHCSSKMVILMAYSKTFSCSPHNLIISLLVLSMLSVIKLNSRRMAIPVGSLSKAATVKASE